MNTNGDIIIVEDDQDHWDVLLEVFDAVMKEHQYENRVIIFEDSTMVLDYLKECKEEPFLIISDVNMPFLNGYELYESINDDPYLTHKATPYILMSGAGIRDKWFSNAALFVQGYFVKPTSFTDYKLLVAGIFAHWSNKLMPPVNTFIN